MYEPGSSKKGIPILTEDEAPELAPITVANKGGKRTPAPARASKAPQPEQEPAEQKKRPFLVVLLLLAVLLIAAVVANILINAFSVKQDNPGAQDVTIVVPTLDPQATTEMDISAIMSEQQLQQQAEIEAQQQAELEAQQAQQAQQEAEQAQAELALADPNAPHTYEVIKADVGWLEAQQAAREHGGTLAVINSEDELNQVVALAEAAGIDRVWIGAHREDGNIVWESGENVTFYPWDAGEPSLTDSGDGAAEDYVMLWRHGGKWVYNDSRENPLIEFYGMYGGHIGYAVEKVG